MNQTAVVRWGDSFYVDGYLLAADGHDEKEIAAVLGVKTCVLRAWMRQKPAFKEALERGWQKSWRNGGERTTLSDWVYGHLDEECQKAWDEVDGLWKEARLKVMDGQRTSVSVHKADLLGVMDGLKEDGKQALFLHAVVNTSFDLSAAMKMIGISKYTYDAWRKDPNFSELIDQIVWHKGNFFESALVELCARGNPAAIMFANRTFNRGRGYGEALEVNHSHVHKEDLRLEELDLPTEVLEAVLEAIKRKKRAEADQKAVTYASRKLLENTFETTAERVEA